MEDFKECCRILDVQPGASLNAVKSAYRELVKVWHPDRFPGDPTLQARATEKLKAINLAYAAVLKHQSTRDATATQPPKNTSSEFGNVERFHDRTGLLRFKRHIVLESSRQGRWLNEKYRTHATRPVRENEDPRTACSTSAAFSSEPGTPVERSHYDGIIRGNYYWVSVFEDDSWILEGQSKTDVLKEQVDKLGSRWHSLRETKQWPAALAVAVEIANLIPDETDGWEKKAFALHELGRTAEARELLLPLAQQFPSDDYIRTLLACYECRLGNLGSAKNWLKQAKRIAGKESVLKMCLGDSDLEPLQGWLKSFWF